VLDIGCGRGEFLMLLREHGIGARGIDTNAAMVQVTREKGLQADEGDALSYLRAQPDQSLGGLFAAQVVEHLEPSYLIAFLDAAFDKLRPGAPIVLETINPACWFAFFESYIRDITHVRPLHPETLKYLMIATGLQRLDIRYRVPYPEHEKLQPIAPNAALADSVETLNGNVEKINRLLFTYLDYAAIGYRP
jgi:2-polyprenyl-3-methyl-5-hydroxy-6-metoxy-1,4-benzoquinol methylase